MRALLSDSSDGTLRAVEVGEIYYDSTDSELVVLAMSGYDYAVVGLTVVEAQEKIAEIFTNGIVSLVNYDSYIVDVAPDDEEI